MLILLIVVCVESPFCFYGDISEHTGRSDNGVKRVCVDVYGWFCLQSYRGRKPSGPISSVPSGPPSVVPTEPNGNVTIISNQQQPVARPSPQPAAAGAVHMLKPEQQALPVQQQSPMVRRVTFVKANVVSRGQKGN